MNLMMPSLTKLRPLSILSIAITFSLSSPAAETALFRVYLPKSNEVFEKVVTPFPAEGSRDLENDWGILLKLQKTRTAAECEIAGGESFPTPSSYFKDPAFNFLTKAQKDQLSLFFTTLSFDSSSVSAYFKNQYNRLRPYQQRPDEIIPCISRAQGLSYPSGHATVGMVVAYAMIDIFPGKEASLIQRGLRYGANRVLGGVHFPSDVAMGQRLARAIIVEMRKSSAYQRKIQDLQQRLKSN